MKLQLSNQKTNLFVGAGLAARVRGTYYVPLAPDNFFVEKEMGTPDHPTVAVLSQEFKSEVKHTNAELQSGAGMTPEVEKMFDHPMYKVHKESVEPANKKQKLNEKATTAPSGQIGSGNPAELRPKDSEPKKTKSAASKIVFV